MKLLTLLPLLVPLPATTDAAPEVTLGSLLREMYDLSRLARLPEPGHRTVQFSSHDRRSSGPESPGWFSNSDGFGREPIPNFAEVLREPDGGGVGLYLVADVEGPGAIVRGWSAGMGGTLRVYLDGGGSPVFEGPAHDFLARRSERFLGDAGIDMDTVDAFVQEDADYFPVPFGERLRVTWEGKVGELHFYQLQVRLYGRGATVRTFDPAKDLEEYRPELREAVAALTRPGENETAGERDGKTLELEGPIAVNESRAWSTEGEEAGAIRELTLKLHAESIEEALRSVRLRIAFDGSMRHQVDAPVGDFFGSGPGVNPFSSLPFSVSANGTMTSRFVMPFARTLRVELHNFSGQEVRVEGRARIAPWTWDTRSMHFRARWRVDHDLLAGAEPIDVPYAVVIGEGVFVGCAAMIVNPSRIPTAWGNWWGEGDEKILVDGEAVPSTFGTGSEDYFNYSWSRSELFDHPYCGQPLDSGPDTSGYVSNHRFQILDAIPFSRSMAVFLELWSHTRTPGLSYARIAYHYARPGAVDDHRALMPSDLRIPVLPLREPLASHGSANATFHRFAELECSSSGGEVEIGSEAVATAERVVVWRAQRGQSLEFALPVEEAGERALHVVAIHSPVGAVVRARLGDRKLVTTAGGETVSLRTAHARRNLNVHFRPVQLTAEQQALIIECTEPGEVVLDYVWVK